MNLRRFRIGWRLLVKEPAYSGIVVAGLRGVPARRSRAG
jgi:putative ABC transport system permease protein